VITPAHIDRLAAALRLLGWKLIYGLNLARAARRRKQLTRRHTWRMLWAQTC
jgi:hypothetical protein